MIGLLILAALVAWAIASLATTLYVCETYGLTGGLLLLWLSCVLWPVMLIGTLLHQARLRETVRMRFGHE